MDDVIPPPRILIVDDEAVAIDLLRTALEHTNVAIASTTDSRDALRLFDEFQPDLVLLDLIMPGVDGLQILRTLRARIGAETYLPILVVTGHPEAEARRTALAEGASDLIAKPYDPIEVVLRVRNLLETRRLHRQLSHGQDERALHTARTAWERTFDAIPDHLSILDMSGRIVAANRTMRERFEPTHGTLIGLDYRECYCGTATPDPQPPCAAVLTGGPPIATEGPLPALEGWFWVTAYPLFDRAGVQTGAVSVVRDETARRQTQLALHLAQEELAASRSRTEFLSRMSHELRTPLNAILGFGQVLDVPGRDPEDAENIRQILTAGRHLLRMVDGLLDISTSGTGGPTPPEVAVTSAALPPKPDPADGRHDMLLYIEDNASNLRLMKRVLARRPGIALLHTSLGQRGVELAREHRPNLILLDLHLPDMSGDEVLAGILRDPVTRDTPVVIVSADATAATAERLRRAGATEFLVKPLDLGRLLSIIDRLVASAASPAGEAL